MPRGDNPNSRKNLIKNSDLTPEERREKASMMGKASGESRRVLKTFQELDNEYTTDDERKKMLDVLKRKAEQGNLRAWELYANYMGMKPVEKVSVATVNDDAIEKLQQAIEKRRSNNG